MKLNPKALGLACGILWGAALWLVTIISVMNGYAAEFLKIIANIYPGYSVSGMGSIVGAIYGFVDGFVGCYVFAWLYNQFAK